MQVAVGRFASRALNERLGPDLEGGVEAALLYYVGRARLVGPGARRPDIGPVLAEGEGTISCAVDPAPVVQALLRREAGRLRLPLAHLVTHAVLVYLADLDAAAEATDAGAVEL